MTDDLSIDDDYDLTDDERIAIETALRSLSVGDLTMSAPPEGVWAGIEAELSGRPQVVQPTSQPAQSDGGAEVIDLTSRHRMPAFFAAAAAVTLVVGLFVGGNNDQPFEVVGEAELGWDVVVGSRRHDQTTTLVRARRLREIGGRLVNWLTHLVLLGHFRDTQCGVKAFRGEVAESIFARTRLDGFAFDVEVFLIAEQDRLSLAEVPVRVENREGSSVRIVADTAALVADLFRIRRWAGEGWYRHPEARVGAEL